ncbi:CapA family protein [Stigmatella sp. ncwal1]|uniref:CapA family protein n=1 Tax=Stigmatella ashevillensis TaxID=2995309 RepID=A0ABT5D5D7_9BACT|nr:CapA family protein [Stigmatella ashevillena]MDC0708885.1 CapA family protein [Stigmatella ashevillena]
MPSPYPWHYTLRWPLYFYRPSIWNRTRIGTRPLEHSFFPHEDDAPLRLLFLGDIMSLHGDRISRLDPALTKLLSEADLVIGNCEAPVMRRPLSPVSRNGFVFNMSHEYLRGIVEQFEVKPGRLMLSVANNHTFDQGEAGYVSTQECFAELGIQPLGLWNGGTSPISRVEVRGMAVGVAAWTQWMNIEPERADPGVWRQSHVKDLDAEELKRRHALDLVVAFPHWEYEFQHFPHPSTREFARHLNARQFKLIVGCHPHVVQPMEWFDGGLCAYSIGNFCGLGVAWSVKLVSLLEVRVGTQGEFRGKVVGYRLHPFIQYHEGERISLLPLDKTPAVQRSAWEQRLGLVYAPPQQRSQAA